MEQVKLNKLKQIALNIRLGAIESVYSANSGHPGGSLSIAEVLAYLYFEEMNVDSKNGIHLRDCMRYWRKRDISLKKI